MCGVRETEMRGNGAAWYVCRNSWARIRVAVDEQWTGSGRTVDE